MKTSTKTDDDNNDNQDASQQESSDSNKDKRGYVAQLEARLSSVSNELEEKHMEAAIDAELEGIKDLSDDDDEGANARNEPSNPNSVANCLSPFVPTSSERIQAFVDWVGLTSDDVMLDIGCGDGRVCTAAAKLCGCRTIGIDVSPLCINQAKSIVNEEGMESLCSFYKTDATVDPELLFSGNDQDIVSNEKRFLSEDLKQARAVVTLTYHIPHQHVVNLKDANSEFDFQWYTKLKAR